MNKLIAMGIGGLIGAGIGYVIANIIVEQMMPEEEVNSDLIENEDAAGTWHQEEMQIEELHSDKEKRKKTDYSKIFIPTDANKPELSKLAAKYNGGIVDEEDEPAEVDELLPDPEDTTEPDPDLPYLIKGDAWLQNHWKFRQVELIYYSGDDILTTDTGAPLNDPEGILGPDALTSFGEMGTVYVCNEKLESVYSVRRLEENFYKERDVRTKRRKPVKVKDEEE